MRWNSWDIRRGEGSGSGLVCQSYSTIITKGWEREWREESSIHIVDGGCRTSESVRKASRFPLCYLVCSWQIGALFVLWCAAETGNCEGWGTVWCWESIIHIRWNTSFEIKFAVHWFSTELPWSQHPFCALSSILTDQLSVEFKLLMVVNIFE